MQMSAFRTLKPGDQVVVRVDGRDVVCTVLDVRPSSVFDRRDIVYLAETGDVDRAVPSVYADDSHVRGPTALSLLKDATARKSLDG